MTEDEAKTKWCPFVRVASNDGTAGNRHILSADGLNGADRCIASACMAWIPHAPRVEDRHGGTYHTSAHGAELAEKRGAVVHRGEGDCGLKQPQ